MIASATRDAMTRMPTRFRWASGVCAWLPSVVGVGDGAVVTLLLSVVLRGRSGTIMRGGSQVWMVGMMDSVIYRKDKNRMWGLR
jgi:hypothetical protein